MYSIIQLYEFLSCTFPSENKHSIYYFSITISDIDECALKVSGCQQNCKNAKGSFVCQCNLGYALNDDRRTCRKVEGQCI